MLLESPRQVRFNKVYFTIFREILIFGVDFAARNSNKLQKLGLDECVHTWALNFCTLPNF